MRKTFNGGTAGGQLRSFREFVHFTGVTELGESEFCDSEHLESIVIPAGVRFIRDYAFSYCMALKSVELKSENPPQLGTLVFDGISLENLTICVPASAVERYKAASGWSACASRIVATE